MAPVMLVAAPMWRRPGQPGPLPAGTERTGRDWREQMPDEPLAGRGSRLLPGAARAAELGPPVFACPGDPAAAW
jgi:hypothetical protein